MARRRSRPWLVGSLLGILLLSLVACSGPDSGDGDPTTSPDDVATLTPTTVASSTSAATASLPPAQASPTATATATNVPPTATATAEPTQTPTSEPTPTQPPAPTAIPQPTNTPVASDEFITIRTAETDELIVALTFDAGSDRGFAADILDTLANEGVVASFGMTGVWAEANPDLIERIADEGHMLLNHTWDHKSWTGASTGAAPLTSDERADQLARTEIAVRDIAGVELAPYFRPPYGDYDDSVIADLQASGYSVNVMWTVDSLGWNGLSADEITRRVVDGTVPGAIHLFHVGSASQDAAALSDIIHALRDRGYRFVTVAQMVGR